MPQVRTRTTPVPELLLAAAVVIGGLWIYGKSSPLTFFGDDWRVRSVPRRSAQGRH